MKNDVIDPREIYKFSKNESVDLNSDSATLHLDNIIECEAKIKELLDEMFNKKQSKKLYSSYEEKIQVYNIDEIISYLLKQDAKILDISTDDADIEDVYIELIKNQINWI